MNIHHKVIDPLQFCYTENIQVHGVWCKNVSMEGGEHTFLGGLDWTVLAGKEIMGKSSDRLGGGEEVAGVPFPPAQETIGRRENSSVTYSSHYSQSTVVLNLV